MARATATFLAAALVAAIAATQAAEAQAVRRERVDVPAADTPVTIEGSVKGYDLVEYQVGAAAGDTIAVALAADDAPAYFNVYAPGDVPGESTALFIGRPRRVRVRRHPDRGRRLHRAGLPDARRRRRAETADYRVTVELSAPSAAAPEAAAATAPVPRAAAARATAGGQLPCAAATGAPMAPCRYRVAGSGGATTIVVTLPTGVERQITFVGRQPVASNRAGAPITASPQGSGSLVSIGEERYEIPYIVGAGR